MNVDYPITTIEMCAGYGGIGLGLKRVFGERLRTIAYCELEGFAQANLISKMEAGLLDAAPLWNDLKTFPYREFHGLVDILIAGYPCQPFSAAGKRAGKDDPRHLWPWIADGIRLLRPRMCFFENVEGHISLGLSTVISDLEELGYKVSWGIFSASEVGAPHQRKRVFILAERSGERGAAGISRQIAWQEGIAGVADHCGDERLANAECVRLTAGRNNSRQSQRSEPEHCSAWPSRPGEPQHAWEPPRVVVDAKSQRAGQRSELRGEECGSRSALPWDVKQSGEGRTMGNAQHGGHQQNVEAGDARTQESRGQSCADGLELPSREAVAHDHRPHAGHGEERPQRKRGDLPGGCGEELDDASRLRSREPADGSGQAAPWIDTPSDEAMGNANHGRLASGIDAGGSPEADRRGQGDIEQADGGMGYTESWRRGESGDEACKRQGHWPSRSGGSDDEQRKAEQSMGLHSHGTSDGLGHSELSTLSHQELAEIREWMVKCDNRTDELRLLGNGVCPPTATKAFITLYKELFKYE